MAFIKIKNIRGKGNDGMYTDRFPRIYAAGIRTKQPDLRVADCLNDSNIDSKSVSNIKNKNVRFNMVQNVRSNASRDMRNAGLFTESSRLINPPVMSKFMTLVEDLKTTIYKSYWNNQVGQKKDLSYCTPPDLNNNKISLRKNSKTCDNLYDIVLPNRRLTPEKKSAKSPGYQIQRNYCKDSFNPNAINGSKSNADRSGNFVKCCLTDENVRMGNSRRKPLSTAQRNFQLRHKAELETCLTPNNNIDRVPKGHAFGKQEPKNGNNILTSFTNCKLNPEIDIIFKCMAHLNTLRKCLSKKFDGPYFRNFYLQLRYLDKPLSGWLPKEVIYRTCITKFIRFSPNLIEPLLKMWGAIDDTSIEYKKFINVINFREPLPDLPKVWDISPECLDFCTTYKEMVTPHEPDNSLRAGIPSGRYFDKDYPVTPDGCCRADRSYLPQESDVKSCLSPSLFTQLGISHRDMFTERSPENVKRVFQAAGEDLNEDVFNVIWDCATKYHPTGIVSYETFRRALNEYNNKLV